MAVRAENLGKPARFGGKTRRDISKSSGVPRGTTPTAFAWLEALGGAFAWSEARGGGTFDELEARATGAFAWLEAVGGAFDGTAFHGTAFAAARTAWRIAWGRSTFSSTHCAQRRVA